uniref:Uncharacterized protein n=1 Tax=Anguilla anguilla TaxID=7936 RepID=A0A0E9PQD2_ANGAN
MAFTSFPELLRRPTQCLHPPVTH